MHLKYSLLIAPTMLMAATTHAAIGTDSSSAKTTSYFTMFFRSDDMLGQLIILLLVLLSAFTVAYIIKLFVDHRRSVLLPAILHQEVKQLIGQKKYRQAIEVAEKDRSYLGLLISSAMHQAPHGYSQMQRAIEEVADAETSRMLRPIEYLNVIGNISPMMGLLGTVYGMIVAFEQLVAAAGRPEPHELAAGIGTALVTTLWGLIVAMPALAGYALIRNKVDTLTADGLTLAEQLIRPFNSSEKDPSGGQ